MGEGGSWDEGDHPRDENGKFSSDDILSDGDGMKTKIDGVEFEVSDQLGQALEKYFKAAGDLTTRASAADAQISQLRNELDKQRGRADAAEAAIDHTQRANADADDLKRIDTLVAARADLFNKARSVLGRETRLDGKDAITIKKDVIAKLCPEVRLNGKSDAYVEALFDHSFAAFQKKNPAALALTGLLEPPGPEMHHDDDGDPRLKFMREQVESAKKIGQTSRQ